MTLTERIHALVYSAICMESDIKMAADREHLAQAVVDKLRAGNIEFRLGGLALLAEAVAAEQSITPRAQQELAHLTRIAEDVTLEPTERAGALLTAHQRRDARSCLCGWDELGKSHAAHQADALARAGLLGAEDGAMSIAGLSESDLFRFEVEAVVTSDGHDVLDLYCACRWHTDVETPTTLAELVQRAAEHAEVCTWTP